MSRLTRFWAAPPLVAVLLIGSVVFGVGVLLKELPCRSSSWSSSEVYSAGCYSDIPPLYFGRGIADGLVPYVDQTPGWGHLEYPVLTGAVMWATGQLVDHQLSPGAQAVRYFDVTAALMGAFFLVALVFTWQTGPRGPTAALLVALSPAVLLTSTINWDWLAVAGVAAALWAWSRDKPAVAGVMIGLGAAAKFYPLLLLGPVLVLCLRDRDPRRAVVTVGSALGAWLAVNLPVLLVAPEGWERFYTFSAERGMSWGSPWVAGWLLDWFDVPAESLNVLSNGLLVVLCVGVAVLGLTARRAPTLAQLTFLVVAAFALTAKVYSPQYVLWLVALAALARPRWPAFFAWQAAEAWHWWATWQYLLGYTDAEGALSAGAYAGAVWLHIAATTGYAVLVVVDVVRARGPDDVPTQSRAVEQPPRSPAPISPAPLSPAPPPGPVPAS